MIGSTSAMTDLDPMGSVIAAIKQIGTEIQTLAIESKKKALTI